MEKDLYFSYLFLSETLKKFYEENIDTIDISLLISLERDYYAGENMKLIMSDLRKLVHNKEIIWTVNFKKEKFKVKNLKIFVGDALNQHMFYYRHCADYFDKHNVSDEEQIPLDLRKDFEKISRDEGKQEGIDWFMSNIDALNMFSDEKILTKNFEVNDHITTLFEETDETPKLEFLRYEYYYDHNKYNNILNAVENLKANCDFIGRAYTNEAEYFYERLERRHETPKYKDLFVKQSEKYLTDETVPPVISTQNEKLNNHVDFYYYGKLPMHLGVYRGKKSKNCDMLNQYINKNVLTGITDINRVTLREKELIDFSELD